jgi:hypothetical protein
VLSKQVYEPINKAIKKGLADKPTPFGSNVEAATGFEPVNNGFADRCLSHLATPPFSKS